MKCYLNGIDAPDIFSRQTLVKSNFRLEAPRTKVAASKYMVHPVQCKLYIIPRPQGRPNP